MGDLNANVGQERNGNIVGPCGMGEKNERGEKLIEFCQSRKLTITNTWFTHPNRRKYIWISPDGKTRNTIDYIMISIMEAQWLSGRMPDSRPRERRHESPTHWRR